MVECPLTDDDTSSTVQRKNVDKSLLTTSND